VNHQVQLKGLQATGTITITKASRKQRNKKICSPPMRTEANEKLEVINPEEKSRKDHPHEFSFIIEKMKNLHEIVTHQVQSPCNEKFWSRSTFGKEVPG